MLTVRPPLTLFAPRPRLRRTRHVTLAPEAASQHNTLAHQHKIRLHDNERLRKPKELAQTACHGDAHYNSNHEMQHTLSPDALYTAPEDAPHGIRQSRPRGCVSNAHGGLIVTPIRGCVPSAHADLIVATIPLYGERILAPVAASQVHTIASISQESRRQMSPSTHFNPSREAPPRPATLPPQSSASSEVALPLALAWKLRLRRIAALEIRLRPLRCKLWE